MRFFILLLSILYLTGICFGRTLDEIKRSGIIRVAVDGTSPPFNYYKGKDLIGLEVDLAQKLAKGLGVEVEWKVQPFNTLLVGLSQDKFDLIATSHAMTSAREKIVEFLTPHYCTGSIIVSKPGGPKTATDLIGKTVSVAIGTVYYDKLKTISGIKEIKTLPGETIALQTMLSGRADAWVSDQMVAQEAIKTQQQTGISAGESILPQKNAMAVAKGNITLQKQLDQYLKQMFSDGSYMKLLKKYIDSDVQCK
ncbi:MAG: ABC transporter substrate-binding protein [Bacteriovoracia bacterium]